MLACGTPLPPQGLVDGGTDAGTEQIPRCERYQERNDGGCSPVAVTTIESQPLSFTRAGYTLNGTITRPVTTGAYLAPGVVLIHGSGPNDRDETLSASLGVSYGQDIPVFRQLAEALALKGMAVYRYDKRNCFKENSANRCPNPVSAYVGELDAIRVADTVLDARAAVNVLAAQPGVDAQELIVIGHSEGANYVPLILRDAPQVRAGVQLAGAAAPIDQIWVAQLRDLANYLEAQNAQMYATQIAGLRSEATRYEGVFLQIRAGIFPDARFEGTSVPQWKDWFESTDHLAAEFKAVKKPIYVFNGDFDFNVDPRNFRQFKTWSVEANMSEARFMLVPNVTHAMVTLNDAKTEVDPNFSPVVITAITRWHRALMFP